MRCCVVLHVGDRGATGPSGITGPQGFTGATGNVVLWWSDRLDSSQRADWFIYWRVFL